CMHANQNDCEILNEMTTKATPQKDVGRKIMQLTESRHRRLENEISTLTDVLKSLIQSSKISFEEPQKPLIDSPSKDKKKEKPPLSDITNKREGLQIAVNAAQIVNSAESLLTLVSELKQAYLLSDFERLNAHVEKQRREYIEKDKQAKKIIEQLQINVDNS